METTGAEGKHYSWQARVTGRRSSSTSVCLDAEQLRQDLRSRLLSSSCEGDKLQAARPERPGVNTTQRDSGTGKVGVDAVTVIEDGGCTGDYTSTWLHSAAEETLATTGADPMCNELTETGPAVKQCLTGAVNNDQAAGEVFAGCESGNGLQQKSTELAEPEGEPELPERVFVRTPTLTRTTGARGPTQGSSQFTKLKSFLNVFFPHKVRAKACGARKEKSALCHAQPQLVVCVPPGSMFVPTDDKQTSKTHTCGSPGSPTSSRWRYTELARSSDKVVARQSCGPAHDAAGTSRPSRKSCTSSDRSGHDDSCPSSSCETRRSTTSSTGSVQQHDMFGQDAFPFQQDNTTGGTAAFAILTRTTPDTGTMGKGIGRSCEHDELGEVTQNLVTMGKPADVRDISASAADRRDKILESTSKATERGSSNARASTAPKPQLLFESHFKTQSQRVTSPEVGCDSVAKGLVDTKHNGRTTDGFLSRGGGGWASMSPVTNRCCERPKHPTAVHLVMDNSKQLAQDTGFKFQGDRSSTTEARVTNSVTTAKPHFNACHSRAVGDRRKASPGRRPDADGTLFFERTSAAIVRDDTPVETGPLRGSAKDKNACSSDFDSMVGSGTSGLLTHIEGDNSSCTFYIPVKNFSARSPSSAPAACPVLGDTCAVHLLKEDLFPTGHYRPTEYHQDEEESCSAIEIHRFQGCTETRSVTASVSAHERSSPTAVDEITSTATSSPTFAPSGAGTALLSSKARCSATAVRPEAINAVSSTAKLDETGSTGVSAQVSATVSPAHKSDTMIDRPLEREDDIQQRRIHSSEGKAMFRMSGVGRAAKVGHVGGSLPQISTVADLYEVCTTADGAALLGKREKTQATSTLLTPVHVDREAKDILSVFPTSRACTEYVSADRRPSSEDFTYANDDIETEERNYKRNCRTVRGDPFSQSAAEPLRGHTSSSIGSKDFSGPECGDFARSKMLSIAGSFRRGHQRAWLAQHPQQQPDVRGGSVFLFTPQNGEAAARQTSRAQQKRAAGGESCSRNQCYGESVRRRSWLLESIRREWRRESRKECSIPFADEEQKESRQDERVLVLKGADVVVENSVRRTREKQTRSHGLSSRQVETTSTGAVTAFAAASAASTQLTAVAPDVAAAASPTAAETSKSTWTTTPATAGTQDVSATAVGRVQTSIPSPGKPSDRDIREAHTGTTVTVAASRRSRADEKEEVNIRLQEGVHYSLLTLPSSVPQQLKERAESVWMGKPGKHLLQQEEQTGSRPHVWNGDSFGLEEFLKETTATQNTPRVEVGCHTLTSVACNISGAVGKSEVDAKNNSEGTTVTARSFPTSPEANTRASARVPLSAGAGAESTGYDAGTAVIAAVVREFGGREAAAATTQRTEKCLLCTNRRSVETQSNDSPISPRSRIFLSELHTQPTETTCTASCSRRKEHARNRPQRMASCPSLLGVYSPIKACLSQRCALRPLSKRGAPQVNDAAGVLTSDTPLRQQRTSQFAARCRYRSLQLRSATGFPDRLSFTGCHNRDVVSYQSRHPSVLLLLPGRDSQVDEPYKLSVNHEQPCQRWISESSLYSFRKPGCERVTRGTSMYLEKRLLRSAQHKRNLQLQQQDHHIRHTQAGQQQEGMLLPASSLQTNCFSYVERRKSVSLLFQRRRTAAALAASGSGKRTKSLDVKHVRETGKSLRHRERDRERREVVEMLPCSSESDTTRCATSCGEGEFEEATAVLRSVVADAPSVAVSVDAVRESTRTSSYARSSSYASLSRHSQMHKIFQQRPRRFSDIFHLQEEGRHKSCGTEMSHRHFASADRSTLVWQRALSCGPASCAADPHTWRERLRSASDDTRLLRCLSTVATTTKRTSSSGDIVHRPDSDSKERVLAALAAGEAFPLRSQSFSTSSSFPSSYVCHLAGSTCDDVCSSREKVPQQNNAQQQVIAYHPPLDNTGAESMMLRYIVKQHANSDCGEDVREELFLEHDDIDLDVDSPESSVHSVVFSVEEDSAHEDFDDDGNLPIVELLPLLQQSLSQKVRQQHPQQQHPMQEYDNASGMSTGSKTIVVPHGSYSPGVVVQDGGEANEFDTAVSTLLECSQALDTCWNESAREVNVYVPPCLHSLSETRLSQFFHTAELPSSQDGTLTPRVKAAVAALWPQTTAASGGIAEGVEQGGRRRRCAASATERTLCRGAVTEYRRRTGAAGDVNKTGESLDRQGTYVSVTEQKAVTTPTASIASSASPTLPYLHAVVQQHTSITSSYGDNKTSVHHFTGSNRSEDACCCTERLSRSAAYYRNNVTLGYSPGVSAESFSGTVSTNTSSSDDGIRDFTDSQGAQSEGSNKEKWGGTDVKGFSSGQAETTDHLSSAEELPVEPQAVSIVHSIDGIDASPSVENSTEAIPAANQTSEKAASPSSSSSRPPVPPTSCAAAEAVENSSKRPTDSTTEMVSLEGVYAAAAETGHVPLGWPRTELLGMRTEGDARVECGHDQLLTKQQHLHMEHQQKHPEQRDQKQRQKHLDGKQQQECDVCKQEQQQQLAKERIQKTQGENVQAHEQHGSAPSSMLHPSGGKSRNIASDEHHENNHVAKGCTGWQLDCLQEANRGTCTAAAVVETGNRSRDPAEFLGDEEDDAVAGRSISSNPEQLKAEKSLMDVEVEVVLESHQRHDEQISACKQETTLACMKEENNIACLQRRENTDDVRPSTESTSAERERAEASGGGTVIMQVQFSSLLLLLCDADEALLANLPYFEGPLCLSTRNAAGNGLRRQSASYPSRLLTAIAPAAAHAERLFYFVLSRGHLFWFTERSAFISRGFDACVGSVSLLLNACRIVCRDAPMQQQQQQKRLLWGRPFTNYGSSRSSSNCGLVTADAAAPSGVHDTSDRFSLQFYTHANTWSGVDKPALLQGNIKRVSGIGRRSSFISAGIGTVKGNGDAGCLVLDELELRVVSGAVFCPTTTPLPLMSCRHETSTSSPPSSTALVADNNGRRFAVEMSNALPVYIGHAGRRGSVVDGIGAGASASGPSCEGNRSSFPLCGSPCASSATTSFAVPADSVPTAAVSCMSEEKNSREGSATATAAASPASALSSFGRHGPRHSGRRSAEKKVALASYAAAWMRHMQNSIAQGEDLRRRFPQVDWAQHQLRARLVASRCGVF